MIVASSYFGDDELNILKRKAAFDVQKPLNKQNPPMNLNDLFISKHAQIFVYNKLKLFLHTKL